MDLKSLWQRGAKGIVVSNLENGRIFEDKIINKELVQDVYNHGNESKKFALGKNLRPYLEDTW